MEKIKELRELILNDRKNGINYAGYDTVLSWIDELIRDEK